MVSHQKSNSFSALNMSDNGIQPQPWGPNNIRANISKEKLSELLTCKGCNQTSFAPSSDRDGVPVARLLKCGHTFCNSCIYKNLENPSTTLHLTRSVCKTIEQFGVGTGSGNTDLRIVCMDRDCSRVTSVPGGDISILGIDHTMSKFKVCRCTAIYSLQFQLNICNY